jgi:anti-anti-sigma factor
MGHSVYKTGAKQDVAVIEIEGFVDTAMANEFEQAVKSILNSKCYKIIIDLNSVEYVSSAGWAIFLSYIKEVHKNGGDIKLVRMQIEVYEIFELLELYFILRAYATLEEAISDFA